MVLFASSSMCVAAHCDYPVPLLFLTEKQKFFFFLQLPLAVKCHFLLQDDFIRAAVKALMLESILCYRNKTHIYKGVYSHAFLFQKPPSTPTCVCLDVFALSEEVKIAW